MTATGFDGWPQPAHRSRAAGANHGNTNYTVPGDADTARISSVILWCSRFGVPFGAAQLHCA